MPRFRPFSEYKLSLTKLSDGRHNLQAEAKDGSHHVEFNLSPDQALELLSKGYADIDGRVNGTLGKE